MRWNLRMTAAERGIWKSTEMRRRLAEAGLEVSAGKMSRWWTTTPVSMRLEDLDVICAVLECTPGRPDGLRAGQGRRPQAARRRDRDQDRIWRRGWADTDRCLRHDRHHAAVPDLRDPAARDAGNTRAVSNAGQAARSHRRRAAAAAPKRTTYTSGLCSRCHHHAPGPKSPRWESPGKLRRRPVKVASCPDCLAWGVTARYGWMCVACKSWREKYGTDGQCATCGRNVPVSPDGSCRLCHKHRNLAAQLLGRRINIVSLAEANAHGQQLFIAGTWRPAGTIRREYVKKTVPADMSLLRPVAHRQLVLFDMAPGPAAGVVG